MVTAPNEWAASLGATTRLRSEAELHCQNVVIVATEPRPQSGGEGQMVPEPCAMLVVYTMPSWLAKWVAKKLRLAQT
ncbi:hypothetical protein AA0113_g12675 [Alternaria arborescens]|uniref:Uncharacterized protein n=1 Tax=Alternaria arborescens TaxID=156630 RepID=A0A4Q4PWB9_9PLEO|nr:hypothetical protein AA0113_g12675 [Alternaria arborescens]